VLFDLCGERFTPLDHSSCSCGTVHLIVNDSFTLFQSSAGNPNGDGIRSCRGRWEWCHGTFQADLTAVPTSVLGAHYDSNPSQYDLPPITRPKFILPKHPGPGKGAPSTCLRLGQVPQLYRGHIGRSLSNDSRESGTNRRSGTNKPLNCSHRSQVGLSVQLGE